MSSNEKAALVGSVVEFLERIGLPVRRSVLDGHTFMPGVSIGDGALLYDEPRLTYPGDLLHEAGHMAVMPPAERAACTGDAGGDAGAEMAAIAWSYAAACAMGIDCRVVFHADAYGKGGHSIAENFEAGRTFGVPLLQWFGMTTAPGQAAGAGGEDVFPRMRHWLRQEEAPE